MLNSIPCIICKCKVFPQSKYKFCIFPVYTKFHSAYYKYMLNFIQHIQQMHPKSCNIQKEITFFIAFKGDYFKNSMYICVQVKPRPTRNKLSYCSGFTVPDKMLRRSMQMVQHHMIYSPE